MPPDREASSRRDASAPAESHPWELGCSTCQQRAEAEVERLRKYIDDLPYPDADAKALRAALFPFLRLDHDIGDEWAEDCQRARSAYEGRGA